MQLFLTLLFAAVKLSHSAPQGSTLSQLCAEIPQNPAAGQIGSQYLAIAGCDGSGSGESGPGLSGPPVVNQGPPVVNQGSPSNTAPGTSSNTGMPVVNQPVVQQPNGTSTETQTGAGTGAGAGTGGATGGGNGTAAVVAQGGATIGQEMKSTVTRYGQGPPGTPGTDHHCQANQGACENNPTSGWTAALSQFLFFHGGADGGSACGTCWKIAGGTDESGKSLDTTPIVVMITNECAAGPPDQPPNLCGMSSLTDTNSQGANVNVDLCMDSGASQGFFGNPPWGTAIGSTAQQVDCASEWCGVYANGTKSGPAGCSAPGAPWAVTT